MPNRRNQLHVITEYRPAGPSRARRVLSGLVLCAVSLLAAFWFIIMVWSFYMLFEDREERPVRTWQTFIHQGVRDDRKDH